MTVRPYKEYLPMSPNQPIYTDLQGKFITVEDQANHLVVYFDNNSEVYHKYNIYLVETGKTVDIENAVYVKTLMCFNGNYVLHVYVEELE